MTDRVRHDHPTVEVLDAELGRFGGTHRPEILLPETDAISVGTVLRVVLDGIEYRALVDSNGSTAVLRGAYDTPRMARNPGTATNHLVDWVDDSDLDFGRTVHVDIVEPGEKIGIRSPGESATYAAPSTPKDSLASIARQLEDGD